MFGGFADVGIGIRLNPLEGGQGAFAAESTEGFDRSQADVAVFIAENAFKQTDSELVVGLEGDTVSLGTELSLKSGSILPRPTRSLTKNLT